MKTNKIGIYSITAMQHDKKKAKGVIKFALPVKIGEVQVGVVIENLAGMLEEVMRDA